MTLFRRPGGDSDRADPKIVERYREQRDQHIDVSAGERSVMLSASETMSLLHSLDDPDPRCTEMPSDFNYRAEHKRFKLLVEVIDAAFSCSCNWDDRGQDTTELGRIVIPEDVLDSPVRIVISISNFGRMAIVTLENPSTRSDEETKELMAVSDRTRIENALGSLGYTYISEDPLDTPYDGELDWPATWRFRFFEYV